MKRMRMLTAALALGLALGAAAPQAAMAASEWPLDPGDYVEISTIKIDDGHMLDYANHLAGDWRKSQDFSKAQGWITDYQIWMNEYPRAGEPDIYLVTWVPKFATPAEEMKRDEAYKAYMKTTEAAMQAASGKRDEYRHLSGSMLMKNLVWPK